MSISGSDGCGSGSGQLQAIGPGTEEASALVAWRGAVQSARAVLVEASRLCEDGSGSGVGSVLTALRRLEGKIEGQLEASPASAS